MNLIELQRALRQLRLGGMAAVLETRLRQAQSRSHGAHRSDLVSGLGRTHAPLGPTAGTPPQTGRLSRSRQALSITSTSASTRR